jgi:pyrophosphatase PpaX
LNRQRSELAAALFDLDGTLIDSIGLIESSFRHTLEVHGHRQPEREAWLEWLGRPLALQFGELCGDDEHEVARMIATYREHNFAHHDTIVTAFPGAIEAVQRLRERGVRLAIVTSKRSDGARRGLLHCGFGELFEVVVAVDDVVQGKPHPEPVTLALARLGVEASRAVMVGDSPHDLASGRAAGTRTAAALWGPFSRERLEREKPDVWLEEPAEIAALE